MTGSHPEKPSMMDKIKDTVQKVTHTGPHADNTSSLGTSGVSSSHRAGTGLDVNDTYGTGATGTGVSSMGSGVGIGGNAPTTVGPHSSDTMNKLDPRVDSDLSGGRNTGLTGSTGPTGSYMGSTTGHTTGHTTGLTGTTGYGSTNTGLTGTTDYGSTNTGLGSNTASYGSSNLPGTGNAPTTAGPHNSDMLNKLDPRVDSDLDGSKRMGSTGNPTY